MSAARTARPPTAPPAMAPALLEEPEPDASDDELPGAEGGIEVAPEGELSEDEVGPDVSSVDVGADEPNVATAGPDTLLLMLNADVLIVAIRVEALGAAADEEDATYVSFRAAKAAASFGLLLRKAPASEACGHPALHGFVLQHPQKGGIALAQVQNCPASHSWSAKVPYWD